MRTKMLMVVLCGCFALASVARAVTILEPIATGGHDADIILENDGTPAQNNEIGSRWFFEQGLFNNVTGEQGLPVAPGRSLSFVSALTGDTINYTFNDYGANNVLMFKNATAKTLTLTEPAGYGKLAVICSGGSLGTDIANLGYTINYAGGGTQTGIINIAEWSYTPALPAGMERLLNLDRANLSGGNPVLDNTASATRWCIYVTELTPASSSAIESIVFGTTLTLNGGPAGLNSGDDVVVFGLAGSISSGVTHIHPENGATYVALNDTLSWDPPIAGSLEANFTLSGYNVYFDPNEIKVAQGDAAVKVGSVQTQTTHDPYGAAAMAYQTSYYWRVDLVGYFGSNPDPNIIPGRVFKFTTLSQDPEIITQPVSQVRGPANEKPDAALAVEARNATNYQWYKNDVKVTGATQPTLTITGVQLSDEGRYYCKISNTNSPLAVVTDDVWLEYARLTGQWEFEQNLVDGVGGNNGTYCDPNFPDGQFGAGKAGSFALALDGVNKYVNLPAASLPRAGMEMSFAFWAFNNTPTVGTTVLYGSSLAAPDARLVNIHTPWSNNNAYFDISNPDAAGSYDRVGVANALVLTDPARWAYWVFTKDVETGIMRIYRDGVQVAQATGMARRLYGAEQFFLGRSGTTPQYFNGMIDDLRIYNYALDNVEAAWLYTKVAGGSVCVNAQDPVLAQFDYNHNCIVDPDDLAVLASHWMDCQLVPDCIDRP